MSYIVFARKYRPQTFDDIDGQPHIVRTLKNAITQERVAHAYLFSGPRGVGKTTTARVLAKALNCDKGPAPNPCNSCPACDEITKGASLDVLEIDGASNRGIEEIRNLREGVKFKPSKGRFRIYIVDEVHMLTQEAFNALLKTLEEPPLHVKFIFATTQAHKLPLTILSRCQRFDFHRISSKDILENLKRIKANERLNATDDVLNLIARHSDGSMRDAQVLLDQIMSFAKDDMRLDDVIKMLGLIGDDILFALSDSIRERDALKALKLIGQFINEGGDCFQLVVNLIEHFRNIVIIKISKDPKSISDWDADKIKHYESQAKDFSVEDILYIMHTLSNAVDLIKKTPLARIPLETTVIRLTRAGPILALADIMARLTELEKKLLSGLQKPQNNEPHILPQKKEPEPDSFRASTELDEISSGWAAVINRIRTKKISIASYLEEGYPIGLDGDKLLIGFSREFQFHKEVLDTPENRRLIEESINACLNLTLRVALKEVETLKADGKGAIDIPQDNVISGGAVESGEKTNDKEDEPLIKDALEIFGGEIRDKLSKKK
ncbi:MAG: DNA polymerase III, subunit gamma and tau [Omnitrophica bacterium RIFCSPLOWO2_01_FULL_45_10]|nr:MAG: DNA polymerase III, subunit gamma and tau [Omnitrophica bacterium RIFCSPLOWO2_01_FULL_45_10]